MRFETSIFLLAGVIERDSPCFKYSGKSNYYEKVLIYSLVRNSIYYSLAKRYLKERRLNSPVRKNQRLLFQTHEKQYVGWIYPYIKLCFRKDLKSQFYLQVRERYTNSHSKQNDFLERLIHKSHFFIRR